MQLDATIQVPHLTTALTGPLFELEKKVLANQFIIEAWFRKQWQATPPLFYSSVDLRNAGFKLAPVDTNLFPAGFNNLNKDFLPLGIQAAQAVIDRAFPNCQKILLIPESHTRNLSYLDNVAYIQELLTKAGFAVRIGSLMPDLEKNLEVALPSGKTLLLESLKRNNDRLQVGDFTACFALLNNDLSEGIPSILQNLSLPITPPLALGWSQRLKSTHFHHYQEIATEFAQLLDIDPWLISPIFTSCGQINLLKHEGEESLAIKIDEVLQAVKRKYQEYHIDLMPYVAVKAEAGTYGMGVMMIQDAKDIFSLNRKERTRMATTKGQKPITQVIIQEGVYTFETLGAKQAVAEPVIYMIGQHVIGGFYRVHTGRGITDNLNAPGAHFEPLAFAECCNNPDQTRQPDDQPNRFYAYGVIARLACLAAAREKQDIREEKL